LLILKELSKEYLPFVSALFLDVFSHEPWNDDWSDSTQLSAYMEDLTGNRNSLSFGLFLNDELIGISLGHIRHWYEGTEYFIDEFCIARSHQRQGFGGAFIEFLRKELQCRKMDFIFLLTGDDVPAYDFYRKNGFERVEHNVAMALKIREK